MKLLLFIFMLFILQSVSAQSLDYISVRKKNGRVVKNFYAGSTIILQTTDNGFVEGPINTIRNDSVFVKLYDIRVLPTIWGTFIRDTVSRFDVGVYFKEIKKIYLFKHQSFLQRTVGPLLMIGGAGYLILNVVNGAILNVPITDPDNLRRLGIAAGVFGLGYLIHKLFSSDGFTTAKHRIVYVDL